jgi:hypothetical protein
MTGIELITIERQRQIEEEEFLGVQKLKSLLLNYSCLLDIVLTA